ncbi:phosphoglucosamine mutase [Desulforegula conservatrix]|uniref:phosphoglucosamine mutase n=1 Tax=Desulforegula conservatrix TaxID=153026 RepID=UPI0003FBC7FD|nr:phosphoglucosamine mutase [Desulforegula conservatrix]
MSKLFGTDGIRGRANSWPITPDMGVKIGKAAALFFAKSGQPARIVIGRDTRISGEMMEMAISSGIMAMGGTVFWLDVAPTPAVAYLTKFFEADAGIVISASHNPFHDNGVKFFDAKGLKLSLETEKKLAETILDPETDKKCEDVYRTGNRIYHGILMDDYREFLKSSIGDSFNLEGLKIIIDCANGASSFVAPKVLESLGAEIITIFNKPDGLNINNGCGSEHVDHLKKLVIEHKANAGLAFDGDADRLIAVDEKGNEITGDQIIAICSARAIETGHKKAGDTVVTTVMSNIGLKIALEKMGLQHEITDVGDRNVLFRMIETGSMIGGEDSGHMIFLDNHTTGDGIYSAIKLLEALKASGKPLSELSGIMSIFPQILINIDVREKPDLDKVPAIHSSIMDAEKKLEGKGRVLVRYSGTQPMCRVMVEGECQKETEKICNDIAGVVRAEIGA